MKQIEFFDALTTPLNILGGLVIGNLAATYSWWILLISIPYMFFMGYSIYFARELKKRL